MSEVKEPTCVQAIAPLPEVKRGYPIHLSSHTKNGDRLAYTSGNDVFLRDLKNLDQTIVFTEHKSKAKVAKFSKSGTWVASGDARGEVHIWEVGNKKVKSVVPVCSEIYDLDWDDTGKKIAACGDGAESKCRVFTYDSGNSVGAITKHTGTITSVAYKKTRPFRVATASEDLSSNFYEGPPFKYSKANKDHSRYPNTIRYAPDGNTYITVGSDMKIFEYDGKTGDKIREIADAENGHTGAIYTFAYSPDSKAIVTGSADKSAKIWDLATGTVEKTFTFAAKPTHVDAQMGSLWHDDGTILTVSGSGAINFLDRATGEVSRVVHGLESQCNSLAVDAATKTIYTASQSGVLTRTDLASGDSTWYAGKGHNGTQINCCTFYDGKVFSAGLDQSLRCSPAAGGDFGADATPLGGDATAMTVANKSPTNLIVVRGQGGATSVVVCNGLNKLSSVSPGYTAQCVAISPDDSTVAVGTKEKKIHIYDFDGTNLTERKVLQSDGELQQLAFKPDEPNKLVSADKGRYIYTWDLTTGENLNQKGWQYHKADINTIRFSPSGARMASGASDNTVVIWSDFSTFKAQTRLTIPISARRIKYVEWLDETTLCIIGFNNVIQTWKIPA